MATLLSNYALRYRILQLPPTLRTSAYQSSIRASAYQPLSPARRNISTTVSQVPDKLLQAVTAPPTALLDAIHVLGLPWWAALPVTAVLVRGVLGYYLASLPNHKTTIIRSHLAPLSYLRARNRLVYWVNKATERQIGPLTRSDRRRLALYILSPINGFAQLWSVAKSCGVPLVTWRSFFNFGMMITFLEAVRIKCGTREGLLSIIVSPLQSLWDSRTGKPPAVDPRASMSPEEIMAERLWEAREAQRAQQVQQAGSADSAGGLGDPQAATDVPLSALDTNSYADLVDPSLKVEGLAWCRDLTLADSSYLLPLSMGAVIVASALLQPREPPKHGKSGRGYAGRETRAQEGRLESSAPSVKRSVDSASVKPANEVRAAMEAADKLYAQTPRKGFGANRFFENLTTGQRVRLSVGFLFMFFASHLPAAVLLYLIPTIATGVVQSRWLNLRYPVPKAIQPCTRPLRERVRKEIPDV
ncbi:Hypothetical predicted protein [Lecanosticta acicola]|uniref:Uncharacterized protein n=1 Tax=Lecanosticta acicola TaxID=111012 RepID=A0AAI8YZY3_9PEZI|nr:Hypothetical predicted protein [Lecanosticta acicola]